jgi:hypothetical protein
MNISPAVCSSLDCWRLSLAGVIVMLVATSDIAAQPFNVYNVPECVEEGTTAKIVVHVTDENDKGIAGAKVRDGTLELGTTDTKGYLDTAIKCEKAGDQHRIIVTVPGRANSWDKLCINKKKDKDGNWVAVSAKLNEALSSASQGTHGDALLDMTDVIKSSFTLSFGGHTFQAPQPTNFQCQIRFKETLTGSGLFVGEIKSYYAAYPAFAIGPLSVAGTTVALKESNANFLAINTKTGKAYGAMQTKIQNNEVDPATTRHLVFNGTYNNTNLNLQVAGFLVGVVWIPTVSHWGLIILTLLLLTVSTIYIVRYRSTVPVVAGICGLNLKAELRLFDRALFCRTLAAILLVISTVLVVAYEIWGGLDTRDIVGATISGGIFAYLLHLWIASASDHNMDRS